MSARDEVLARVRHALAPRTEVPEVVRAYRQAGAGGGDVVGRFCERAADYRATVRRVPAAERDAAVSAECERRGARRVAVPPRAGLDNLPGVEAVVDDPPMSPAELDLLDGVVTGCALAIADTGTIVLDGGPSSGRRALTLVPDFHVCVVKAADVVAGVPDAIAALGEAATEGRPITFVSGPSATSDIELDRVEGVHGPRTLVILVLE